MSEMGPESGGESSALATESSGGEAGEGHPAEGGDAPDTERAGGEAVDTERTEQSVEGDAGTSSRAEPGENGPAQAETLEETENAPAPRQEAEAGRSAGPPDITASKAAEPEVLETAGGDKPIERNTATDKEVDQVLERVNPNYESTDSAYSENCTGVVQANELQRRGFDVQAGPLEPELRRDHGGIGGRPLSAIEQPWGREFTPGTKSEIEAAFQEPGSRGVVYIRWDDGTGSHVFNVENVGGAVRFVDAQTVPPVTDASGYFDIGSRTKYLRLDDLPTPPSSATAKYVEPRNR